MKIQLTQLAIDNSIDIAVADDFVPLVAVCSYPRSGTHFVINSIVKNSYYSHPRLDFDLFPLGGFLNFYSQNSMETFINELISFKCASILKSHHSAEFFSQLSKSTLKKLKIIYPIRNAYDTLLSNFHLFNAYQWHEGPKAKTPLELIEAPVTGQMRRHYQSDHGSIFETWAQHCKHWLKFAKENSEILIVKYENLEHEFESGIKRILDHIGVHSPNTLVVPSKTEDVIIPTVKSIINKSDAIALAKAISAKASLYPELPKVLFRTPNF